MLVGPCGCPNCCCEGLIKQLGLEIACRCESVIKKVVHFGCDSFDGRLEDSVCLAVLVCLKDLDKAAFKSCFFEFVVTVPSSFVSSMMLAKSIS